MFRKHLAAALAALLAVAACAPCVRAQSGRRFPHGTAGQTAERAPAVEVHEQRGKEFDLRELNAGRSASVVYAQDKDKHPNKVDKIAGAALLGYLIFAVILMAKSDGYAPTGGTAPYSGLRR